MAGRKAYRQKLTARIHNLIRFRAVRKTIVSGEHTVAIVPPVRVLDGVRIDVPAVVVPVHVDRAKHTSVIVYKIIYITASQTMTG